MGDRQFTRTLATIMSIDAVGFSRLMGQDEEAAVAAFEERSTLIGQVCRAHGGRMFGAAGDSLMAEFGNAADALRAAFEFQARLVELNSTAPEGARMPFRAGINTGDVIVRDDSRYGDDVNISARLQEIAPTNGVVISETAWHHVHNQAAATFRDLGEQSLKNIVYPVRAFLAMPVAEHVASQALETVPPVRPGQRKRRSPAGPPAIAVLPFRVAGDDAELAYVAEGIAEDIIMGLSSTRWLPVIARSSSFQFRDDNLGAGAAGRALGARYVVSGHLARHGTQLRLRASLEDVSAGKAIWSRRFDRDMDSIFDLQDEIGGDIVAMLEKEVDRAEQARAYQVPWESLETWQFVRRGRFHMARRTRDDAKIAFDLFHEAFRRDPNSTAVLNELAWWHFWRAWLRFGVGNEYHDDIALVVDYSRKALFMDSQDARPHAHLGAADIMLGEPTSALDHLAEALRINPSFAFARSCTGSAHLLKGESKKAIAHFLDADRLSPYDLYRFHNYGELSAAYSFERNWPAALDAANRSLQLSPSYWYASVLKAGALVRLKRPAEARQVIMDLHKRDPNFRIERTSWIPFKDKAANAYLIEAYAFAASA
ncbi:MAG: adenylate/guanylate cyclase domain-containing protein [Rhizobiaceae bacterium]|nr:adenylate/guanylate cyclase domain-containing protein [Rhizobiaceae bacterium]MCV0406066.1 adenylate/guanylate cyclase domain-containing protein [Rhizobiaceae bacterium]